MRTTPYWAVLIVVAMLGTGACADGGGDPGAPAATLATTTTTQAPSATEEVITTVKPSEEPLVYVVMGNSLLFSTPAVMHAYKDILEEDLEVEVAMRNHTVGGQATHDFLEQLQTNDRLRADLAEADVILFLIPNDEWKEPCNTIMGYDGRDPADCGGDDGLQCLRSVAANYRAMAELAFEELMTLTDPSEALIRVMDYYVFTPGEDDEAAVETLGPLWQESQEYIEKAAARYGIPVAQVFDEFMGPVGTRIPEQKGLVSPDGIHLTTEGSELIAQLIRELGYERAGPQSAETVAVTGTYQAPDEHIDGDPTIIRATDNGLSDDRVNGDYEALMDVDIFVESHRSTGLITMPRVTITNDGGTWEGTAVGVSTWTTSEPEHRHYIHHTLLGTGNYEGLQFTYLLEGIDYPWTVTGTIEPVGL
ncbi:MAG: SGNH/GDSL hydrolase family protein [Acidimicrobiia bacterium]|nr:SGNH/GDSL hydrolase family protein [Acidimicrobiia bacterium]